MEDGGAACWGAAGRGCVGCWVVLDIGISCLSSCIYTTTSSFFSLFYISMVCLKL